MFRPLRALILASALALCAPGCGFKGPLVLAPEQPAKKAPARATAPEPTTAPAPATAPAPTPPEPPAQ